MDGLKKLTTTTSENNMSRVSEKYGNKAYAFAESLIGTCQMGEPSGEYYGIEQDDVYDVLAEYEDVVRECTCCGWMCDGQDGDVIEGEWTCSECIETEYPEYYEY